MMEQLAPLGPVYQAGTLSGNPVAMAAGLARAGRRRRRRRRAGRQRRPTEPAAVGGRGGAIVVLHQLTRGASVVLCICSSAGRGCGEAAGRGPGQRDMALSPQQPRPALGRAGIHRPEGQAEALVVSSFGRQCLRAVSRMPPPPRAAAEASRGRHDVANRSAALMRHGEVYNAEKILSGRLAAARLWEKRPRAGPGAVPMCWPTTTSCWWSPPRWSGRRRPPGPSPPVTTYSVETDPDLIESLNFFEGRRVSPGDGAWRDPAGLVALRHPMNRSWGEQPDIAGGRPAIDKV